MVCNQSGFLSQYFTNLQPYENRCMYMYVFYLYIGYALHNPKMYVSHNEGAYILYIYEIFEIYVN